MYWLYLILASVFEVGWTFSLKMASLSTMKIWWIILTVVSLLLSGVFLYFAQKGIPIGTAYAVWTGIGAACTFITGVILFHDVLSLSRVLAVCLIVVGVVILKFAH